MNHKLGSNWASRELILLRKLHDSNGVMSPLQLGSGYDDETSSYLIDDLCQYGYVEFVQNKLLYALTEKGKEVVAHFYKDEEVEDEITDG